MAIERITRYDDTVDASVPVTTAYEEEVVTVRETDTSVSTYITVRRVVSYVLGVVELLLAARFLLRMLGANPASSFVNLIYTISGALAAPFNGMFRPAVSRGAETASVIEPSTLIAMIVYAILAWGIMKTYRMLTAQRGNIVEV